MLNKSNSNNKFAFWIAVRYLFSKKSHNAVNIISGISVVGITVVTMALIVVLSVFNGFEDLGKQMFSAFDPSLKISLSEGKRFTFDKEFQQQIEGVENVVSSVAVIEESALVRYDERQSPISIMGVGQQFNKVTDIDKIMYDGVFSLHKDSLQRAVLGVGIASKLGANPQSFSPLILNAPKRTERINIARPETSLITKRVQIAGVFSTNQPVYDDHIILISLPIARQLFQYPNDVVTSIFLKVDDENKVKEVKNKIKSLIGKKYDVLDRYEQQKDFFKIAQIEKWITFLILSFILMIAIFNIIGSLSLLIIDKKENIVTLRSLGCSDKLIKKVFLFEGWLISLLGAVVGLIIGVTIVLIQQYFGVIKLGNGYIIDHYPTQLAFSDVLFSLITVLLIGFISVLYPVKYIKR